MEAIFHALQFSSANLEAVIASAGVVGINRCVARANNAHIGGAQVQHCTAAPRHSLCRATTATPRFHTPQSPTQTQRVWELPSAHSGEPL